MELGTRVMNTAREACNRMRPVLVFSTCLLLASAGFAQTNVDPLHAMSPAQVQRATMLQLGQVQPAANCNALRAAIPSTSAKGTREQIEAHGPHALALTTRMSGWRAPAGTQSRGFRPIR